MRNQENTTADLISEYIQDIRRSEDLPIFVDLLKALIEDVADVRNKIDCSVNEKNVDDSLLRLTVIQLMVERIIKPLESTTKQAKPRDITEYN